GMNTNHKSFFVIGAIKNADFATARNATQASPHVVMGEILVRRSLERENIYALRVHTGHDVFDGAVLSSSVHGLKNEQKAPLALCVENILQPVEGLNSLLQNFFCFGPVFGA